MNATYPWEWCIVRSHSSTGPRMLLIARQTVHHIRWLIVRTQQPNIGGVLMRMHLIGGIHRCRMHHMPTMHFLVVLLAIPQRFVWRICRPIVHVVRLMRIEIHGLMVIGDKAAIAIGRDEWTSWLRLIAERPILAVRRRALLLSIARRIGVHIWIGDAIGSGAVGYATWHWLRWRRRCG